MGAGLCARISISSSLTQWTSTIAHVHAFEQVHEHSLERLRRDLAKGFDFRIVSGLLRIRFERDVRGRSLDEQYGDEPQDERDEDEF